MQACHKGMCLGKSSASCAHAGVCDVSSGRPGKEDAGGCVPVCKSREAQRRRGLVLCVCVNASRPREGKCWWMCACM